MHLEFELAVADVDVEGRTIAGLGVPWNQAGKIGGRTFKFQRGSLAPAMRRTPLQLGHDGEPVGVLAEHVDDDDGARVTFRVDRTPDGDRALVQAASGSRGALSVGADVDDSTVQADGSVLVTAARYVHFALVPHGAFAGAEVEHVVAHRDTANDQEGSTVHEDRIAAAREVPEPEPVPAPEPEPDDDEPTRSRGRVRVIAERKPADLGAGQYAVLAIRAQRGDGDALRILAALTETPITDLGGVLPPQYDRTVLGEKTVDRVLWSIFSGRPLPAAGTQVIKPTWTTGPNGAWAATLDADATTSAVVIGTTPASIDRWDWAGALPWVAVQRSDPDLLDTIYAAAVVDFYGDVETRIAALLATGTVSLADTLGAGIAAFYDATAKSPEVIVVAPDVWGEMADAKQLDAAVGGAGVSGIQGLSAYFAGLPITASGALAAGERILATRRALDVRISDPLRLTANAIGALNVELGVVGEGLFDVDYAEEIVKLTPPVGALAASSGRSSSKSG
jgi:hypothetical protein